MFKKGIFICLVISLLAFDSFAAITEVDIPFTSDAMKKLPVTFADALAAIKSGVIQKIRMYGNIHYAEAPKNERSLVEAQNEGYDDVSKLLIALFPSNGGVLEISTGYSENFANVLNKMKKTKGEKNYAIFAELLDVCRQVRQGGTPDLESRKAAWKNEIKETNRTAAFHRAFSKILDLVADSISFEKSLNDSSYYPPHMTETLILAFCCYFFNGSGGDVKKLLDAMKNRGLIDDYGAESIFSDENYLKEEHKAKLKAYKEEIDEKIKEASSEISSDEFYSGVSFLTLEQYLYILCADDVMVPYAGTVVFEQNLMAHANKGDGKKASFQDCVETAVRHLVTMMCEYDAEKDLIKVPEGFHTDVVAFFKKYNGKFFTNGRVQDVHDDWAALCQKVPGVEFATDNSLRANWKSFLKAISYFTGSSVEIPEKISENSEVVRILNRIALECRKDVTFEFEEEESKIKCTIKRLKSDWEQPSRAFCFSIDVHGGHSALDSANNNSVIPTYLHRLLELKSAMECVVVKYYQMSDDPVWVEKAEEFLQNSEFKIMDDYLEYLRDYEREGVSPGNVEYLSYTNFVRNTLLYVFDHIDLDESSNDPVNNLLKPIKSIIELLCNGKEKEIRKLEDIHGSAHAALFVGEEDVDKMNRFMAIINHLQALSEEQSENGEEALSVLSGIRDILFNRCLRFYKTIGDEGLEFLRKNTVCNIMLQKISFEDRFNYTASEDGRLLEILSCEFLKGGTIDLSRCKIADNYMYRLQHYKKEKRLGSENIEAKRVIELQPGFTFILRFQEKN
ncbi:MAG: hypothetical protein LBJ71_02520 [Holosporaceae bacterium]|jgi:hypothetical protein|nr:hypothetical protein [Holosporaceae bacterium]